MNLFGTGLLFVSRTSRFKCKRLAIEGFDLLPLI